MRRLLRVLMVFSVLLLGASSLALSAFPAQDPKETGTVTGRVTLDGKPAQGVNVMATPSNADPEKMVERMLKPSWSPRATTDSDGRYRLEGLPAGTYSISPSAPALVGADAASGQKEVTVTYDSLVERIDFALARGGVITGRVTESDGQPAIAALLSLTPVGKPETRVLNLPQTDGLFLTDDRGIYRIFGLSAGRYLVSAGNADNSAFGQMLTGHRRVRTYYPGVTDAPNAKPVEVTAGGEVVGVDIKLGSAGKGFSVSGRIIESGTRKPVANIMVNYTSQAPSNPNEDKDDDDDDDEDDELGSSSGIAMTNAKGEFRLESVAPGRFQARANSMGALNGESDFYADPISFEVRASNVENLVIEIHRGASISGTVVLENADSGDPGERLGLLIVSASVADPQNKAMSFNSSRVAADGSFRISGLREGKARIDSSLFGRLKLWLVRVERNGVEQPDGVVLQPNEQVTGVRLVIGEANCIIRGRVSLQGGSIPAGSIVIVSARALSARLSYGQGIGRVDPKGDFVIDGLPPGSYEVGAHTTSMVSDKAKSVMSAKQTVSVAAGTPVDLNLVLDLSIKERD